MEVPLSHAETRATVTLMDVRLDNLSEAEVIGQIVRNASRGEGGWMVNPNVDVMRQIVESAGLRKLVAGADLVVPDGMPLLWAGRLQADPFKQRVPVSELIGPLCAEATKFAVGVFLLGGSPGSAERAAAVLAARNPGLAVDYMCPPSGFERSEEAMAEIHRALQDSAPGVVFCAFGFPKQERLMEGLSERFPSMWFLGSGGTFSMVAGDTPKAPVWMRKSGLEWLHRLRLEPRRLFARYIVHDFPFALRLLFSSARARFSRGDLPSAVDEQGGSR